MEDWYKCIHFSGSILELLNPNLHFNKFLRRVLGMLKFEKHWPKYLVGCCNNLVPIPVDCFLIHFNCSLLSGLHIFLIAWQTKPNSFSLTMKD